MKRGTACYQFALARRAGFGRELDEGTCFYIVSSERTLALRVGSQEARDHIVHTFRQCLFVILESQRELLRARGDHGIQPWSERVRYMNSFV